ncbi:unnamed protein product [marine sediment metagenome]|uniref:Uncharacterized protein n=1 Tax=marine sediment metagenome TaxID=412755 RepID=X0ULY4_9ZZZZ
MLKNIYPPINADAAYTGEDAQWGKDKCNSGSKFHGSRFKVN